MAEFLQNDLLAQASPNRQAGPTRPPDPNLTVRAALDRSAAALSDRFQGQPAVRASLEHTISNAYLDLTLLPQAREHALDAVDLRTKALGTHHPLTLDSMDLLAMIYRSEGQFIAAERIWTELYRRVAVAGPLISSVSREKLDLGDPPIVKIDTPDQAREFVRKLVAQKPELVNIVVNRRPGYSG